MKKRPGGRERRRMEEANVGEETCWVSVRRCFDTFSGPSGLFATRVGFSREPAWHWYVRSEKEIYYLRVQIVINDAQRHRETSRKMRIPKV